MRILFICENYLPHYGGAEVVFKNLAENYVKLGHEVILLTQKLKGTKRKEIINGVKVYRVNSFNSRYLFTFLSLFKAIKFAKKSEVIQTTSFNGAPPAWFAAKITKKPVVITVHEVWVGKWNKVTSFGRWKCLIHELLEKAIYYLSYDKYVCVSNATRKDLLQIGVKPEKAVTIYNGLDYRFWNENSINLDKVKEIREKLNLKDKFVYFSWGRPGESKGFEYVIKAVPEISRRVPNAVLALMFGSIDKYKKKYEQLMKLIKELQIEDKVKLVDSVPHQDLRYYLKAFDCAVIPSIAEGFGYNAVEAITMGIPAVVSNAGSLPEVVSGKHLMFESKNHLDLARKVVMVSKGEYGPDKVKEYKWEPSVNKYLEVYEELITKNKMNPKS